MLIDQGLLRKELTNLIESLNQASELAQQERYDEAVEAFDQVKISAGRIMQRDPRAGRRIWMDRVLLIADGYKMKAYVEMAQSPEKESRALLKLGEVARGDVTMDNPYVAEIFEAMNEWDQFSDKRDYLLRKRED